MLSEHIGNLVRGVWYAMPPGVLSSPPFVAAGRVAHARARRVQPRNQSEYTRFVRNRCQLELVNTLAASLPADRAIRLAVIGCSTGAELYSAIWFAAGGSAMRRVDAVGVDISPTAVARAIAGVYEQGCRELEGVSQPVLDALFEPAADGSYRVRSWLRESASVSIGDARNEALARLVGCRDLVFANNFLVHMDTCAAEACLRNIARLVAPGGFLVVSGIDLDVRARVLAELGFNPVTENIDDIHEMDRTARLRWPWAYWGLEPLNAARSDWQTRYATVFQAPAA